MKSLPKAKARRRAKIAEREVPVAAELVELEVRFYLEVLREARVGWPLNKAQLARRAGVSPSQVGQVDREVNGFSYGLAVRMSRACGLRLSTLARRAERRAWAAFCQSGG